jgi:hypothetical protein
MASQRLLDKLTAVAPAPTSNENDPTSASLRASLSELNLPLDPSHNASSSSIRPNASRTPTSSSFSNPRPTHSPQPSYSKLAPPPLPYSPRNLEKERKLRRETITKEMARLKEAKGVERKREGFDSPTLGSPKKGGSRFEDLPAVPETAQGGISTRGKKNSWE